MTATPGTRAGGRVFQLTAPRTIAMVMRDLPEPGPGEVLIRPTAVGLCGTDLHAWRGRTDRLPIVPTHDGVGRVVALGPDVDPALAGARVVIDPVEACGGCDPCRRGHPGVCTRGGYLGMTVDGLLADGVAVAATRVARVPDEVDDVSATVLEPVAIACRLLADLAVRGVPAGPALVVGAGTLGLIIAAVLRANGWTTSVAEPDPRRRTTAERLGLRAGTPEQVPATSADVVVDTSAALDGTRVALESCRPGGVLVLLGRSPAPLPAAAILLGELDVLGVRGAAGYYPQAIAVVAAGVIRPGLVVDAEHDVAGVDDLTAVFRAHDGPGPPLRAAVRLH